MLQESRPTLSSSGTPPQWHLGSSWTSSTRERRGWTSSTRFGYRIQDAGYAKKTQNTGKEVQHTGIRRESKETTYKIQDTGLREQDNEIRFNLHGTGHIIPYIGYRILDKGDEETRWTGYRIQCFST
jgi:hypothetical protein